MKPCNDLEVVQLVQVAPLSADATLENLLIGLDNSCMMLCNRKTPSTLYEKDFEHLKTFSIQPIWDEMKKHPLLIDVLKTVSGSTGKIEQPLKLKFTLIYSILMQQRWHELSLFQRVNTVQVIKGKCSKEVRNTHFFLCQDISFKKTLNILKTLTRLFIAAKQ